MVRSTDGRGPWGGRYDPVIQTAHHGLIDRFVAQIPSDASVTATAAVHPHVALRRYVYQFPIGMPEFGEQGHAEWALLDVTTNTDLAPGDLRAMVMQMLAADWGVVNGADGFLLLRRGIAEKQIPDAFYDFARAPNDGKTVTNRPLTLVDIQANDWPRWRTTKLRSQWVVGPEF